MDRVTAGVTIDSHVIGGGGGDSAAGRFEITGTVGQSAADTLAEVRFGAQGGFWHAASIEDTARFSADAFSVSEADGRALITVVKSGGGPATVTFLVTSGSAAAGLDYLVPATQSLGFPAGAAALTIPVEVVDDFFAEGPETFTVRLTVVTGGLTISPPDVSVVTIIDNDADASVSSFPQSKSPVTMSANTGLKVTSPAAGAQWRLNWEPFWRPSGATAVVPPGDYEVAFKPLPGFAAPTNLPVRVRAGFIAPFNFSYPVNLDVGGLQVELRDNTDSGVPLVLDGVGWQLDADGVLRGDGLRLTNVPAGRHLIQFIPAAAPGWSTPETAEVLVIPGQTAVITARYQPPVGCLGADVSAPSAVSLPVLDGTTSPQLGAVGQLRSSVGFGSGVAVRERVVLTAAHVVFDDETLAPVPRVEWRAARYRLDKDPVRAREPQPLLPRGAYLLDGYAAQRADDTRQPGFQSGTVTDASARSDAAALWFAGPAARGGYAGYLVRRPAIRDWFVGSSVLLAGYPVVGGADCPPTPGAMRKSDAVNANPDTTDERVYRFGNFGSFPGNSGGPVFAQGDDGRFFPAGIYLGPAGDGASRVRVIDTDVLALINLAASSANAGTNFTGGGVAKFGDVAAGAVSSLQTLRVNIASPAAAAVAKWKLVGQPDTLLRAGGAGQSLLAPTNVVVTFTAIAGFATPADIAVAMTAGQDAILDVTYEPAVAPAPQLSASVADGLRVSGLSGTTVRLQFRAALDAGDWADVPGKLFPLGAVSVTVLTPAEGAATPGFYRAVVVP